jgi:hypothetical protein
VKNIAQNRPFWLLLGIVLLMLGSWALWVASVADDEFASTTAYIGGGDNYVTVSHAGRTIAAKTPIYKIDQDPAGAKQICTRIVPESAIQGMELRSNLLQIDVSDDDAGDVCIEEGSSETFRNIVVHVAQVGELQGTKVEQGGRSGDPLPLSRVEISVKPEPVKGKFKKVGAALLFALGPLFTGVGLGSRKP